MVEFANVDRFKARADCGDRTLNARRPDQSHRSILAACRQHSQWKSSVAPMGLFSYQRPVLRVDWQTSMKLRTDGTQRLENSIASYIATLTKSPCFHPEIDHKSVEAASTLKGSKLGQAERPSGNRFRQIGQGNYEHVVNGVIVHNPQRPWARGRVSSRTFVRTATSTLSAPTCSVCRQVFLQCVHGPRAGLRPSPVP